MSAIEAIIHCCLVLTSMLTAASYTHTPNIHRRRHRIEFIGKPTNQPKYIETCQLNVLRMKFDIRFDERVCGCIIQTWEQCKHETHISTFHVFCLRPIVYPGIYHPSPICMHVFVCNLLTINHLSTETCELQWLPVENRGGERALHNVWKHIHHA